MIPIYVVQAFQGDEGSEKWVTFYVASYQGQAEDQFALAKTIDSNIGLTTPLRLVEFTVNDFDFLGALTRNFAVLDKINF